MSDVVLDVAFSDQNDFYQHIKGLSQQEVLYKNDVIRQFLNQNDLEFALTEDWRSGKLFIVKVVVYSNMTNVDVFKKILNK